MRLRTDVGKRRGCAVARRRTARTIDKTARDRFGFDHLRPGQREAIEAVLAGRDTLAVLPTGAGKSAIYQIAGTLLDGPTIVVSPLIALQRDQAEAIADQDSGGAVRLNSTLSNGAREDALAEFAAGETEFLLLAPEQLANPETLERLAAAEPSLFVVDEAHCISDWGHDFRPDYLRLGAVAASLGDPILLALTATAAPPVRDEIVTRLGMVDPVVIVQSFDRPNIRLSVERFTDEDDKFAAVADFVAKATKPGIVYAATRSRCEDLAAALRERGVEALPYHAGLPHAEREAAQTAFMDGGLPVVVATTAFGMGIDKAGVRFVAHLDISESLDSYYQEIGRAGRDGEPAEARLFYRSGDLDLRRFFAASGKLEAEEAQQIAEAVRRSRRAVEPGWLADKLDLSKNRLAVALARLDEAGAVRLLPTGGAEPVPGADIAAAAAAAAERQEERRRFARSRVEMARAYADGEGCRRAFLLGYFGEGFEPPCGNCDACEAGHGAHAGASDDLFAVGTGVTHERWGDGSVVRSEIGTVTVLFESAGYRTLDRALVLAERLLRPATEAVA